MTLYPTARSAFQSILEAADVRKDMRVLLPGYIGWSPREGSGVLDPISALGLSPAFYRMDDRLHIDLEDFERQLRVNRVRVAVIIHYFGYVDPQARLAIDLARAHGAIVVEDEAHALFTDLVSGIAGRWADAALFSLHKMLPVTTGGALIVNDSWSAGHGPYVAHREHAAGVTDPATFDLARMAQARRANAEWLLSRLNESDIGVEALRPVLEDGTVPQTLPVLIHGVSRDQLYERMNTAGFGVVSLYHTLVEPLRTTEHAAAGRLARTIMNLPVHQEANAESLNALVDALDHAIRGMARRRTR